MMKQFLKVSVLAVLAGFFALPAFAIDQVRLTNGQVVEGTVLNDMTNMYVDIRLVNGDTKRIPHAEVASVDRDVPSRKDRDITGNTSLGFVSVNLGGFYVTDNVPDNKVLFDYGIKAGVVTGQMGDTKIGFALSWDRVSQSYDYGEGTSATSSVNDISLQMLFMRIANTGFYFGPSIGLDIAKGSYSSADPSSGISYNASESDTYFAAGAQAGYDVYLTDTFSVGPEVRYEHIFGTAKTNLIKFTLDGSFHF
jgi:hypothetical protein